jgi:XTP/dITP diphosphohydrolase
MDLIFATHNQNKALEIQALLENKFNVLTLKQIEFDEEIEENGLILKDNALIKAACIASKFEMPVFADDTGLEVLSLNNEPGVRSARYAGEPSNSENNIQLLLKNLKGSKNMQAQFVTWICLILNNQTHYFEGKLEGEITTDRRGSNGFGYDPIFIPKGYHQTLAEMSLEEKNKISHRAKAFEKMKAFLFEWARN